MKQTEHGPIHYRYDTATYAGSVRVLLATFYCIKETPSGYWVVPPWCFPATFTDSKKHRRWVSKTSRKRYCYPSKDEAWESYVIRQQWRVAHLEHQLEAARAASKLTSPDAAVPLDDGLGLLGL